MDVHGTVVTKADQLPAALKKAAAAQAKAKAKTSLQLLEADHVYNPDKQDAAGEYVLWVCSVFACLSA